MLRGLLVHIEKPTLDMQVLTTFGVIGLVFHLSRACWRLGRGSSRCVCVRGGGGEEGREGEKEGGREGKGREGGEREGVKEGGSE